MTGLISQIVGPVVDVHFSLSEEGGEKALPKIHDALKIVKPDGKTLIVEVQQHIGEDTVRCVALDSTDGLKRGLEAISLDAPISMPTGAQIHAGR